MIKLDGIVKTIRSKGLVETKAAVDPGNGKTPAELEKEILENHKAMLENAAIEAKAAKEQEAKETKESAAKSELEVHTTKPMTEYTVEPVSNPNIECPFCGEEKTPKGMGRHIAAIHEIEGVSLEDLESVERGEKNLKDLVTEKYKGKGDPEVYGLSDDVKKREFADWTDIEPEKSPEDKEIIENPGPPGSPACYENPGEKNPGQENPVERRKFNLIPFYFPFQRRNYRK